MPDKQWRKVRREADKKEDPWFAKRRKSGEMGRKKSKAGRNKRAARGRSWRGEE